MVTMRIVLYLAILNLMVTGVDKVEIKIKKDITIYIILTDDESIWLYNILK